ncbi:MAG: hypothetical protein U1F42_09530 [Candidatus Competibacteraceae bacterium]
MWRDLERICTDLNLPLRRPSVLPNGVLAAQICLVVSHQNPGSRNSSEQVFHANFADDLDAR